MAEEAGGEAVSVYSPEEFKAAAIMRSWKGGVTTDLDVSVEVREYLDLAEAIKSRMLERASQAVSEDRRKAIGSTEAVNEIEILRKLQAKYPEVKP